MPVEQRADDNRPDGSKVPIRTILLLCDEWRVGGVDGVVAVNKSLAMNLIGYEGCQVTCVTVKNHDKKAQEEATRAGIQLLSLGFDEGSSTRQQNKAFNKSPENVWTAAFLKRTPEASFIVGHFPGTAEAAVNIRDSMYEHCKVILFYHVIPDDIEWLDGDGLPYALPSHTELVRLAERADVVYSVTSQVHSFFDAKFRNRADKSIDHRLFVPQCLKAAFDVDPMLGMKDGLKVLALAQAETIEDWQGLDIATCAMAKVATHLKDKEGRVDVSLTIATVNPSQRDIALGSLAPLVQGTSLKLEIISIDDPTDLFRIIALHHICLVSSRAEPHGASGLLSISAGIPTIIAEESYLATIIKRLSPDPRRFLVRTTRDVKALRQDAGLWKEKILELMEDKAAAERAQLLKTAAKRDEITIQSHDNITSYCLRGIPMKVEVTHVKSMNHDDDDGGSNGDDDGGQEDSDTRRHFSSFLVSLLKQSWRIKRHPLIASSDDLQPLLPGVKVPVEKVISEVVDKVEDMGRRIVEVNDTTGSLAIYCPNRKALRDLWSVSDRISKELVEVLTNDPSSILTHFKLKEVKTRFAIPGPDFLKYNEDILSAIS